ncbi:hypothetical protein K438DRAFT_2091864 [Mycena galopus ATCC 62051]|nr:hypothetical protein K438DRAFT_2091864 [Mycena galopus ATCC 62051]
MIAIVLIDGSTNERGVRGWMETPLRVVSVTMGILGLCIALVWVTQEERASPCFRACRQTPQPGLPNYWLTKIREAMGQAGGWLFRISKPHMEPCGECSGEHEAPASRTEQRQPHPKVQKGESGLPLREPGMGTQRPSETRAPGGSRSTTPGAEDAPGYYPMRVSDPKKQPWGDQEEQTPRTGCASRLKKVSGTAQPYYNRSRGKGATSRDAGGGTMDRNPEGEGYLRVPGYTPDGPRSRNLAQEQAEAHSKVAPGAIGPGAPTQGQPRLMHPKKHARSPTMGGKNGHRE